MKEINENVDKTLETTLSESAAKTSGWKTPFLLLVGGLVAFGVFGYKKYQELRKSHLL